MPSLKSLFGLNVKGEKVQSDLSRPENNKPRKLTPEEVRERIAAKDRLYSKSSRAWAGGGQGRSNAAASWGHIA